MGMYTELVIKASLKEDLPLPVKHVLDYLFSGYSMAAPINPPDHPFFKKDRWAMIGHCSSYYHHPEAVTSMREDYLFSRSDLKNYDGEIESFIDWIKPYINEEEGQCIGWEWYEEYKEPTLIYL